MLKRVLIRVLGTHWSVVTLGPRLATLGARPTDRLRLLALGILVGAHGDPTLFQRHQAHARVRFQGSELPIVLGDASDYFVLAAARANEIIPPFVQSPRTILDCGAHIGTVAMQYWVRFPDAAIYAVEPDPCTCSRLRANLGFAENVTVIQAALAGQTGSASFFQSTDSWTSSLIPVPGVRAGASTTVPTTTLSDLLDRCCLDEVDLLKLDIEGAEREVLTDVRGVARVHAIVAEIHYDLGDFTESALLAALSEFETTLSPYSATRALLVARRMTDKQEMTS